MTGKNSVFAMVLAIVTMCFSVLAGLWALHEDSKAHAAQGADHGARITNVEQSLAKIDSMADDITSIREALGVERGWRRGLLQSLPGAEGE